MKKLSKILCVLDPTANTEPAMQRAAWVAQKTSAELELLVCITDTYSGSGPFFDPSVLLLAREELQQREEAALEEIAESLRADGISVVTKVIWDRPLDEGIVRYAMTSNADIVFKDTHHHAVIKRTLLSNTDWNLIRTCPKPLWLVKERNIQEAPVVMAAIDPTHQNDKPASLDSDLLDIGTVLADGTGAELHVFHAYDPRAIFASVSASAYIPSFLPYAEIEQNMREHHSNCFDAVVGKYPIGEHHKHLKCGTIHEELITISEELPVDVVIMGAIARNQWQRLLIGSTAERTLETLPCDLLIVKPQWIESPVESGTDDVAD